MFKRTFLLSAGVFFLQTVPVTARVWAQEPAEAPTPAQAAPGARSITGPATPSSPTPQVVVPAGTRLPLILRNGINTRTAKPGDSVYFETIYPIAQDNRIVIPMGSFVRGQLLASKRPGFVKGRGEIRMVLDQMTFPNGYTLALAATPNSADRNGKEGVDKEGTIKGPSDTRHDVGLLLVTTGGGAYIGSIAGAIVNGAPGTGALIGGGVGAAAGILAILATRGPEAELPRGTTLDVVFDRPLILDAGLLPANDPGRLSSPLPPAGDPHDVDQREERRRRSPLRSLVPLPRF